MKRFLKGVVEWKNHACMVFTAAVCIYTAIAWLYGERSVGMEILLELLAVSAVSVLLQGIAFSEDWLIRNMAYTKRMLLFVVMFLPVLALAAWAFGWFPADNLMSWGIFLLIFFVIFAAMTAGFEILYRVTGKKYGGLLGQRQKKHGQDEE